jgi:hypothetical protein
MSLFIVKRGAFNYVGVRKVGEFFAYPVDTRNERMAEEKFSSCISGDDKFSPKKALWFNWIVFFRLFSTHNDILRSLFYYFFFSKQPSAGWTSCVWTFFGRLGEFKWKLYFLLFESLIKRIVPTFFYQSAAKSSHLSQSN